MSGNEAKDKSSAQKTGEKHEEGHEDLNNADVQMDEGQLDQNEGGDFDESKNLEEDKNQEGDIEQQDNPADHAEGEDGGISKIKN